MKKTFLPKIPVLGLILSGIFLFTSAVNSSAQVAPASNDLLYAQMKNADFVPSANAIEALDIEIVALKTAMLELTEGTQAYKQLYAKYTYFSMVRDLIVKGKSVQEAIMEATVSFTIDEYEISQQTLFEYQAEVIDIVS